MKKITIASMVFGLILGSLFSIAGVSRAALVTVSAGLNQSITLPTNSVTLTGTASTTTPATITSYAWTQDSGPSAVIATPTTASTVVSGLNTAGTYVFKLTATDSTALVGFSTTTVIVNPVVTNLPPFKNFKSKLEINSNGKINLQGEVTAIGTGTLTVKVWGIIFTVNTTNTNWNGRISSVVDYRVGDMVSVNGSLDVNTSTPTINARNVKNMTVQVRKDQEKKSLELLKKEEKRKEKEDKRENKHDDN